jgi:hypothetical protein
MVRAERGEPGKPGAIVHMHCTEPLSNGKPCGRPSVERAVPFRCSGHLYLVEYPDAGDESRRPTRRPRALPRQAETLLGDAG